MGRDTRPTGGGSQGEGLRSPPTHPAPSSHLVRIQQLLDSQQHDPPLCLASRRFIAGGGAFCFNSPELTPPPPAVQI
jgi:hypothetical protein